jgi:hypothetical protein
VVEQAQLAQDERSIRRQLDLLVNATTAADIGLAIFNK